MADLLDAEPLSITGFPIDRGVLAAEQAEREGREARIAARRAELLALLDSLPALSDHYRSVYLNGGFPYFRPPAKHDIVEGLERNIHGDPIVTTTIRDRMKDRPRDDVPDLWMSSRESTIGLIRNMRDSRWSRDQAETMMGWPEAVGAHWLQSFEGERFDQEFARCWEKAGVPVAEFAGKTTNRPRRAFISHARDQERVYAVIEAAHGAGERVHQRAVQRLKPLEGKKTTGRVEAALKALQESGFITADPQGRGLPTYYTPTVLEPVVSDEGPSPYDHLMDVWDGPLDIAIDLSGIEWEDEVLASSSPHLDAHRRLWGTPRRRGARPPTDVGVPTGDDDFADLVASLQSDPFFDSFS